MSEARQAHLERVTQESNIRIDLNLDGSGTSDICTGVPFFDHMLTAFAKHSLCDLAVHAEGDVHIDVHHTVEDTGILLGQAIQHALGEKRGITRYGDAHIPLDEALARAVIDLSGRPYFVHGGEPEGFVFHRIGGHFTGSLVQHFFESLVHNARITAHLHVLSGRDPHHIAEAEYKAFARAFQIAKSFHPHVQGIPSTKGVL